MEVKNHPFLFAWEDKSSPVPYVHLLSDTNGPRFSREIKEKYPTEWKYMKFMVIPLTEFSFKDDYNKIMEYITKNAYKTVVSDSSFEIQGQDLFL